MVADDEDAAAVWQVIDSVPRGESTFVHLRVVPGLVEDYFARAQCLAATRLTHCSRQNHRGTGSSPMRTT